YRTSGIFTFQRMLERGQRGGSGLECLTPARMGWELYASPKIARVRDFTVYEEIDRALEVLKEELLMPVKPVDVGRYEVVFDPISVANLVDDTLGRAT